MISTNLFEKRKSPACFAVWRPDNAKPAMKGAAHLSMDTNRYWATPSLPSYGPAKSFEAPPLSPCQAFIMKALGRRWERTPGQFQPLRRRFEPARRSPPPPDKAVATVAGIRIDAPLCQIDEAKQEASKTVASFFHGFIRFLVTVWPTEALSRLNLPLRLTQIISNSKNRVQIPMSMVPKWVNFVAK